MKRSGGHTADAPVLILDPSRSFGAWMRRIATHCAIDQLNAARRLRWSPLDDVEQVPPRTAAMRGGPASPGSGTFDLASGLGDPHLSNQIRRAFASLPPKLRVVATLALIEDLPQAEIADALGVPIGTVKSRLFRATRELREQLTKLGIQT